MKNLNLLLKFTPNRYFLTLLLLILSGCTSINKQQTVQVNNPQSNHQAQIEALTNWKIKGKLIVKSPKEKLSASLNWSQQESNSDTRLTTFMGISILKLIKKDDQATLTVDGKTHQSDDAQQLLADKTGFNWPIDQLPMWIKGHSDIGKRQYDIKNRLKTIELPATSTSPAWTINYPTYQQVNHQGQTFELPLKVRLTGQNMTITIKIAQWQINPQKG